MPDPKVSARAREAVELINVMDVHEAAKDMAKRLKLNAQVRTIVGKWNERGQITGWTKTSNTARKGPDKVLVEVFVSDIDGEGREFDRYARQMQELLDENAALRAREQSILAEGWEDIETAPRPRDWLNHVGRRFMIALFHQPMDEDGQAAGELEMLWAHVAYLSHDGWMVESGGFRGIHGSASFPLNKNATHWRPLPAPPLAAVEQSS